MAWILSFLRVHASMGSPTSRFHAYRHPIRVFDLDGLTMLVGADDAGHLLEVGVAIGDGVEFIVHAMPARKRFLR